MASIISTDEKERIAQKFYNLIAQIGLQHCHDINEAIAQVEKKITHHNKDIMKENTSVKESLVESAANSTFFDATAVDQSGLNSEDALRGNKLTKSNNSNNCSYDYEKSNPVVEDENTRKLENGSKSIEEYDIRSLGNTSNQESSLRSIPFENNKENSFNERLNIHTKDYQYPEEADDEQDLDDSMESTSNYALTSAIMKRKQLQFRLDYESSINLSDGYSSICYNQGDNSHNLLNSNSKASNSRASVYEISSTESNKTAYDQDKASMLKDESSNSGDDVSRNRNHTTDKSNLNSGEDRSFIDESRPSENLSDQSSRVDEVNEIHCERFSRRDCNSSDEDDQFELFLRKHRNPTMGKSLSDKSSDSLNDFIVSDNTDGSLDSDERQSFVQSCNDDLRKESNFVVDDCNSKNDSSTVSDAKQVDDHLSSTPVVRFTPSNKPWNSTSKKAGQLVVERKNLNSNQEQDLYNFDPLSAVLCSIDTPAKRNTPWSVRKLKSNRDILVQGLFEEYNRRVFDSKLPSDFQITWNKKMTKTAGFCIYTRRENARIARIELSEKVCDSTERIRDTLIHELCHAATWVVNGCKDGHGKIWKYWAYKANKIYPNIPLISRCHSYNIHAKYTYRCTNLECSYKIDRHSKSINVTSHACPYCLSHLEMVRNVGSNKSKSGKPNNFALFVKENFAAVRSKHPNSSHGDIMKMLSSLYSQSK
ncbi:Acidic repeat-containing protein [Trichoplax sp. H2]|nr:Acidic repeat-containing protein [Trichoplax sp. H2]|eukprot:RDD39207.1 Acidic repeat-containing protein [Trichoplax sp. H2]